MQADHASAVKISLVIPAWNEAALLPRLVQTPWQPCYRKLGNDGGWCAITVSNGAPAAAISPG